HSSHLQCTGRLHFRNSIPVPLSPISSQLPVPGFLPRFSPRFSPDVRLAVTTRSLNALEASTNLAIGRGLLSPGAMAGIRAASPILAKASGYLTVAAITAEAGFVIACR